MIGLRFTPQKMTTGHQLILERLHKKLAAQKVSLEAYSPDQPRDENGRWSQTGGVFVSPNVEENLSFDQAKAGLHSARHSQIRQMARRELGEHAKVAKISDVIGDWSDGAENSLFITTPVKDRDELRYMAAKMGDEAQQKAVIPFMQEKNGKDALWSIRFRGSDLESTRKTLDQSGLQYRTLEPHGADTVVHVFDPGKQLDDAVQLAAKRLGGSISLKRGTGEFLGGDTREEGSRAYHEVIEGYKNKKLPIAAGAHSGRGYDAGRNGYHPFGAEKGFKEKEVDYLEDMG